MSSYIDGLRFQPNLQRGVSCLRWLKQETRKLAAGCGPSFRNVLHLLWLPRKGPICALNSISVETYCKQVTAVTISNG